MHFGAPCSPEIQEEEKAPRAAEAAQNRAVGVPAHYRHHPTMPCHGPPLVLDRTVMLPIAKCGPAT
eukprot:3206419-Karenia_brevis.AAC.1